MLKKEYELLIPFIKEPWRKFTFKDIKKAANKTSESYVYNTLRNFVKQEILKEEKAGNVTLYSAFLSKNKSRIYFGFVLEYASWKKIHIPFKEIEKITEKMPTDFYCLLLAGSYAKNKQKESSDIDMAIIVGDEIETKKVYAELSHSCDMSIPKIHLYVFRKTEFMQMLLNKEANYGKEISINNIILNGGKEYFQIIGEAIENGFTGKFA